MLSPQQPWPPDYVDVFDWRVRQSLLAREKPEFWWGAKVYYKDNPIRFIRQWVDTYDPRSIATGGLARVPFLLFKRQEEFITFLFECLKAEENGLVEKCRDLGATWACCAFAIWLWLFWDGAAIGFGSRKEMLVDRIGDPDSIFEKMRMIVNHLPLELLPRGFNAKDHMTYMRFVNPENGSSITGESGDNIGRGGRKLIYFKDESAHYEHAEMIEASLTDNTRVQIDVSSVFGMGTVFHRRREAGVDWEPSKGITKGKTNVFVMDWRDHPGKTQEWYDTRRRKAVDDGLLHIFAQEVDRNYAASLDGIIIPAEWVSASIDAHIKLGLTDDGPWSAALDVADEGMDTNALAKRKGIVLKSVEEWGERDTGATTRRAVMSCKELGQLDLQYDSVGVGAGVKAEANRLADEKLLPRGLRFIAWSAGAEPLHKEKHIIPGDKNSPINGDFYANLKAQAWWQLRRRFEITYRAVRSIAKDAKVEEKNFTWDRDDLISLPSDLPLLRKIQKELSQATVDRATRSLKLVVDKAPEGTKSPNCADAIVMAYWPAKGTGMLNITKAIVQRAAIPRGGMRVAMRRHA